MGRLIYTGIVSLDGCLSDPEGRFDWAEPDPEVHAAVNEHERPIGTYLYGRRMYEVMRFWQTEPSGPDAPPAEREYAELWRKAAKVVFSRTLTEPTTPNTRLERRFDPRRVRELKETSERDLSIGGADVASAALREGLVDEIGMYVTPVVVGGGTRLLPDGIRLALELVEERRFSNGVVLLRYAVGSGPA